VELYAVGKIVACFGIDGYLKIQPMTHTIDRLGLLKTALIGLSADSAVQYDIDEVLEKNRGTMLKVRGINSRTAAETLVGAFLFVSEKDLSAPPEGSYFVHDIIGATVRTQQGETIGTITDVYKAPGQDIWVIRRGEKEYLLPVVKEFIEAVDIAAKQVTIRPMKGLFDE